MLSNCRFIETVTGENCDGLGATVGLREGAGVGELHQKYKKHQRRKETERKRLQNLVVGEEVGRVNELRA